MVSKIIVALAALAATALAAPSREKFTCGTEPTEEILKAAEEMSLQESSGDFMETQATIVVDTYIHIVAASTSVADGYITDKMVTDQMAAMNSAFAPHSISFVLKGTDRTINSNWASDGNETQMKTALRKGGYSALNLYFLKSVGGNLGYCYFPTNASPGSSTFIRDGCSVLSSTVPGGSSTNYNLGHTATHEVGHWFGLFHTFQGSSCTGAGDSVSDTPQQLSPTSGCPVGRDSCPSAAGLDPIRNYMDYSYDTCYDNFTAGQRTRMNNMWATYRQGK
jgi:hypothetical protein